jgi:hypothetical protein
MRTSRALVILLASIGFAACGGGDDDQVTQIDAAGGGIDAPGGNIDAAPAACTVSSTSFGDKGTLTGVATFSPGMNAGAATDDTLSFAGQLEAAAPTDLLVVELYAGYGVFKPNGVAGPVTTGTFQITGAELDYATCGVCVRILTDATQTDYADDYLATAGTINITSVGTATGQTLAATVTNLTFQHVNIDPNTFESTPAGDTCNSAMSNVNFSGAMQAPMN